MEKSGVYFSPVYDGNIKPTVLTDSFGDINIYMLPFVKPANVRRFFPDISIESYTDAVKTAVDKMEIDVFTGRSYELGVMAGFMARTLRGWGNVEIAPTALMKNKMPFIPSVIHGREEVARIFQRYADKEDRS